MGNRKPRQTGPRTHAEGEHGEKTHRHIIEQLQAGPREEPVVERIDKKHKKAALEGKRRLVEDRQQHDEAEKNSEREQLSKERRHGRNDGPSDNRGSLHGVLGHREHRADNKARGRNGLPIQE